MRNRNRLEQTSSEVVLEIHGICACLWYVNCKSMTHDLDENAHTQCQVISERLFINLVSSFFR